MLLNMYYSFSYKPYVIKEISKNAKKIKFVLIQCSVQVLIIDP